MTVRIIVQFSVDGADVPEFKRCVTAATAGVLRKDGPGTLDYDHFSEDDAGLRCVTHEHYADSDALFSHMQNLGELLPLFQKLMKVERVIIVGTMPPEAAAQLKAFGGDTTTLYDREIIRLER